MNYTDRSRGDAGFTPRITAETGELSSLVELAAEGLGVAVLPHSAVGEADLTVVDVSRPRLQRRTALAWNQAAHHARRTRLPHARRQAFLRAGRGWRWTAGIAAAPRDLVARLRIDYPWLVEHPRPASRLKSEMMC